MKLFLASALGNTISLLVPKLAKPPKENRVIFIANAADPFEGDKWWVESDRKAFSNLGFNLIETDLRKIDAKQLVVEINRSDIIHFCGGSDFYLLSILQKGGFIKDIVESVRTGKIFYTGTSAGSCLVAPSLEIYKFDPDEKKHTNLLSDFYGLGLVNYLIVPHCNQKEFVSDYKVLVEHMPEFSCPLVFLQDNQAIYVEDEKSEILIL
ncbi:MAG: Type 1 glutamine amidotransferase-like domain-containing protein [Candidatus Paceibacterota bacterium]|jgi:dipeptidase E